MRFLKATFLVFCLSLGLLLIGYQQSNAESPTPPALSAEQLDQLVQKAEEDGTVRVIVGLPVAFEPLGNLSRRAVQKQQAEIANAQDALLERFAQHNLEAYAVYETIPYMALSLDAAALRDLSESSLITSIEEDVFEMATLASSTSVIGAPAVWADGHEGANQAVVIIDSGVDPNHSFFGGRVVAEACFSNVGGQGGAISLCPNGRPSQTGSGAADVVTSVCLGGSLCSHGTHVAGIAAGNGSNFDGVARRADIIAIQVFTRVDDVEFCGDQSSTPCIVTARSDQIRALEYIQTNLSNSYNIAAINMSLGGGQYNNQAECDSDNASRKAVIDNLRSLNIATVISSGNSGYTNALGAPACISSAVAVGATTDNDSVASFSNSHEMVDLLAPGVEIDSSVPGGRFRNFQGTSMAAPHVAGAWAVLKGIQPSATIDQILSALQDTGVNVRDTRSGGSVTKPRIQLDAAADQLGPSNAPSIAVNPNQMSATLRANRTEVQTLNINNNGTGTLSWNIEEQPTRRKSPLSQTLLESALLEDQNEDQNEDQKEDQNEQKNQEGRFALRANTEPVEKFGQMARQPNGGTSITHSASQNVVQGNSIACNDGSTGYHTNNSYVRSFDLADDFNINSDFNVTAVEFGVESAEGAGGDQPVEVNIFQLENNTLTLIGTMSGNLPDQALTIVRAPVNGTVPAGSTLVVEIFTPNGQSEGNAFFIGSNSSGESSPSYIYAPDCNINSITPLSDIGFPNMHIVMNVIGNEGGGGGGGSCTPGNIPWASVSPTSGTTSAGNRSQVSVRFNSAGLSAGTYSGNLCVNSNDPQNPQIEVPLTLVVQQGSNPTPTPSNPGPSPTPSNPGPTPTPSNPAPTPTPTDPSQPPNPTGAILRTNTYNVAVGGSVTVKVEAINIPSPGLGAANVSLTYDSSVIRPTSCTFDPALNGGTCNINNSGRVVFNLVSTSGIPGDFDMVDIVFEAVGEANQSSPLDLSTDEFVASNASPIDVSIEDGSVTIGAARGDVSCDGRVNVIDALYIRQYDVQLRSASQQCPLAPDTLLLANCDVNNDNRCSSTDALLVLQCDVGIPNDFCPARWPSSPRPQVEPRKRAGSATVEIGQHEVGPSSTFNVPVTANTGDTKVGAAKVQVDFDPNVVQVNACEVPSLQSGQCNFDNQTGKIVFNGLSTTGVTGNITLADITFQSSSAGTTALEIYIETFADISGSPIGVNDVDGRIDITSSSQSYNLFLPVVIK